MYSSDKDEIRTGIPMISVIFLLCSIVLLLSSLPLVFAQNNNDAAIMFEQAREHFEIGEYNDAIIIYDDILDTFPENISTLKMKGIAQSNLGLHEKSLEQFFKILQHKPNDLHALAGMGVGFGHLGEYEESKRYFKKALEIKPTSIVLQNYNEFIDKVTTKYPYVPTEKPKQLLPKEEITVIPSWVKNSAKLWSKNQISNSEFMSSLEYMLSNKIIKISQIETKSSTSIEMPSWVKTNALLWSNNTINDQDFIAGIKYLIENGIIRVNTMKTIEEKQKELDNEFFYFKQYLREISKNMEKEKRYIEFPNPSQDVIKKFLRDYVKWNFEQEAKNASTNFPDPKYQIINDVIVLQYIIYVNEQPSGLPLDHVGTLENSISFWESQELLINDQKARVEFYFTNLKPEANVWVTWVVRDIGEGVLGHAHLGKGIVEVALGDYNCDGSFQLYDIDSVEQIMRHELGHSVGLPHVEDPTNIMYPSFKPNYAYCLLS